MIKLGFCSVDAPYELRGKDDSIYDRVAGATETVFRTLRVLEDFAKPKAFTFHDASLIAFTVKPASGFQHHVRVEGYTPIDEIDRWQIFGSIGDRTVNVVAEHIFHTHKDNRSGSGEYFINGKPLMKPEFGGVTLDDIWQDSEKWKPYATRMGFYTVGAGTRR